MNLNMNNNIPDQLWQSFAMQRITDELKQNPVAMEALEKAFKGGLSSFYLFGTACLNNLPEEQAQQVINKLDDDMAILTKDVSIDPGANLN